MTHFAPVSPLHGLRRLARFPDVLGTYQLLIAPIVLSDRHGYYRFFQEEHTDQFVIVDNGVIEHNQVTPEQLYEAARIVDAQLIVLPDMIDDAKTTIKWSRRALQQFRALDRATDTMGVVQGTTFEECMECARSLVDLGVDWLSPPRGLTKNLGSRVPLVLSLAAEFGLPMHVLGFSDNVEDDLMAAMSHRSVRGIDAATPGWMTEPFPVPPPKDSRWLGRRPADFWTTQLSPYAEDNIRTVRQLLSAAPAVLTERDELAGLMGEPTPGS